MSYENGHSNDTTSPTAASTITPANMPTSSPTTSATPDPANQVTYTYDGDGSVAPLSEAIRGKLVMSQVGNVVTLYPNAYYEMQGGTIRKYYFAGSQRIAVLAHRVLRKE